MNLLMLRGLSRDRRHWGDFPSHMSTHRITMLDLPGSGERSHLPSPLDVPSIVRLLRSEWQALSTESPGPWAIVGLSLGGMVALEWALTYPADFQRLVLINSSVSTFSPPHQRMRPSCWPQVLGIAAAWARGDHHTKESMILGLTTNHRPIEERLVRDWTEWSRDGAGVASTLRQLVAAARYRPRAIPTIPCSVITSKGDRLCSWRCSQALAQAFNATLDVHPDAGHDLPLDDPKWLAEKLERALSAS